jgi:hypothetical protein
MMIDDGRTGLRDQVMDGVHNRVGKERILIWGESLWEEREEWKRLCHKMIHSDENISGRQCSLFPVLSSLGLLWVSQSRIFWFQSIDMNKSLPGLSTSWSCDSSCFEREWVINVESAFSIRHGRPSTHTAAKRNSYCDLCTGHIKLLQLLFAVTIWSLSAW